MIKAINDKKIVAFCGLYCGACKKFLLEKCPGCVLNSQATWCAVRSCCQGKYILSCAECVEFSDISDCKKFNNFFSKLFGYVFRSDRKACIARIKEVGLAGFAAEMTEKGEQTIKK